MKAYLAELEAFLLKNGCDIGVCEFCPKLIGKVCRHREHPGNTAKQMKSDILTGRKRHIVGLSITIH